ncbi:MAG: hypothetical protein N2Z21_01775 [Candidatus Sumerlaeaceae bacterium]|nr:hypothetical protein [Candidatus Sumerlaeaceae bacterium]
MTSVQRPILFKESLTQPLVEFVRKIGADEILERKAKWELSSNPDFGDYFTTVPIHLQTQQRSGKQLALELARCMQQHPIVQHADSAESGFVNVFISPGAAATALAPFADWLCGRLPLASQPTVDAFAFSRNCQDSKVRFAFEVWWVLANQLEENTWTEGMAATEDELSLLTEPEEFAIILQLHEFPERLAEKLTAGYMYRLAVLIRDGLFCESGIAPYWLNDREYPEALPARRFLVWLCERVLGAGLSLHQRRIALPRKET